MLFNCILVLFFLGSVQACSYCAPGTSSDVGCKFTYVTIDNVQMSNTFIRKNQCPIFGTTDSYLICIGLWTQGVGVRYFWMRYKIFSQTTYQYDVLLNNYNIKCSNQEEQAYKFYTNLYPNCLFPTEFIWGCFLCNGGTFSNTTGMTTCHSCAQGTYSPTMGTSTCTNCLPGYGSNMEAVGCYMCPAGKYSLLGTSCLDCGLNKYCEGNLKSPQPCPNSTMTLGTNSSSVVECCSRYGNINDSNTIEMFIIVLNLVVGAYAATCPVNTYCTGTYCNSAMTYWQYCPPDSYCPLNSENPTPCPVGRYSALASCSCSDCKVKAGFYSSTPNSCTDATPCTAGYYCCLGCSRQSCPKGKYCPQGSSNAVNCPLNYYCPYTGLSQALNCPLNTWTRNLENSDSIDDCISKPGYKGTVDYVASCSPGYYCPGDSYEYKCSNGQFALGTASACTDCPTGSVAMEGSSQCNVCEDGFYTNALKTMCLKCNDLCNPTQFEEAKCTNVTAQVCCER
jgi:hypothetical protein